MVCTFIRKHWAIWSIEQWALFIIGFGRTWQAPHTIRYRFLPCEKKAVVALKIEVSMHRYSNLSVMWPFKENEIWTMGNRIRLRNRKESCLNSLSKVRALIVALLLVMNCFVRLHFMKKKKWRKKFELNVAFLCAAIKHEWLVAIQFIDCFWVCPYVSFLRMRGAPIAEYSAFFVLCRTVCAYSLKKWWENILR